MSSSQHCAGFQRRRWGALLRHVAGSVVKWAGSGEVGVVKWAGSPYDIVVKRGKFSRGYTHTSENPLNIWYPAFTHTQLKKWPVFAMKGFGSAETSDGRASPDGFIRLIWAEIWMAHPDARMFEFSNVRMFEFCWLNDRWKYSGGNAEQLLSCSAAQQFWGSAAQHFSSEYFQWSLSQQNSNIETIIVTRVFCICGCSYFNSRTMLTRKVIFDWKSLLRTAVGIPRVL
jgi:hypothetical protein